ncbi:MAG: cytochrome c peroxidase [Pseudomonadota bacterium]
MRKRQVFFSSVLVLVLAGCDEDGASGDTPAQAYTDFFTAMPQSAAFPPDNPGSAEKIDLGEKLFWDPILSGRMDVACATCHHPDHGWADARSTSSGVGGSGLGASRVGGQGTRFHSPSVLNAGFTGLTQSPAGADFVSGGYFWDLRADTLEEQALEPIRSAVEMRSEDFVEDEIIPEVIRRLGAIDEYQNLFANAFDDDEPISELNIARALATYQRSLISRRTRFDAFLLGDSAALTPAEVVGLNKFINGGCANCHSGPMLSDNLIDQARPVQTDKPAVRTPTLRNVQLTAPYFHDGSLRTLRDAIAFYEERGDLDVILDEDDFGDIERFLQTLTDSQFPNRVPVSVSSQLPVGGNIL